MIIIGLTGATGAGKGLFGKIASDKFGLYHIDTDITARLVVEPGMPCLEELAGHFGKDILNDDGTLFRKKLGEIVFSDKKELEKLNEITHKHITLEVERELDKARKLCKKAAIIDAPLLFESGEDKLCDVTVGIIANSDIRKKRILSRDGITEEMADMRIASGKNEEFFVSRCDYIIENNGNETDFEQQCVGLLKALTENDTGKGKE